MDIKDLKLSDRTVWDDDQFALLHSALLIEHDRRIRVKSADYAAKQLVRDNVIEIGREEGDAWVQPVGAHDSYLNGNIVSHNGKNWVSLLDWNVWEPGVANWREDVEEGEGPAAWVQPTGALDTYNVGDQVTFEGAVYESLIANNNYSPTDYPQGWKLIE